LNAYRLEDPITTLTNAGYNSLFDSDSYSYQFNGQWGSLDHALANGNLNSQVTGAAKWHINSDEPTVLDYNTEFKTAGQVSSFYNVDPFRSSDHDPIVVGLNLGTLNGGSGNDTLNGGTGNDILRSGGGNNILNGGAGNDVLFSSLTGIDNLTGGAGDDVYEIHNTANTIVENSGGGTDTIWTDTSYTMSANIETMYLVGDINGTGSAGDNTIVVYGGGTHTIDGAGGNDTLIAGTGTDTLIGGGGNDVLLAGAGTNSLEGGAGNDVLFSSLTGLSTLTGGADDDVYEIHNPANTIVEAAGGGNDTIWTSTTYTMSANIETMYLVGNINGTGSDDDNTIVVYGGGNHTIDGAGGNDTLIAGTGTDTLIGGGGNDVLLAGAGTNSLEGGAGNDVLFSSLTGLSTLAGGAGDDVYEMHNSANTIVEGSGDGTDTVWTDVSYTLADNVETLVLVGNINGIGSAGDNTIVGYGSGTNVINGGAGNDTLYGGAGSDVFVFDSSSLVNAVISGIDTIGDFTFNQDKIRLDRAVFQSLYDITEENFSLITNDLMTGSESGGIFYNTDNGRLFYTGIVGDSDIFTTTQFAQLGTGLNLTATDFTVDNSLLI
jgi:Ca2+-binding RTX toxin-like protein